MNMNLEPRIEAVIALLRKPNQDSRTLIPQAISIIPFIKNTLNLKLLLTEIAQSVSLFTSVDSTSYLIEGITAAANRKKEISNPTISNEDFFKASALHASTLPLLPGLAILSGLALAKPPNMTFIIKAIIHNARYAAGYPHIDPTLLSVCLAKAQWVMDQHTIESIPLDYYWPYIKDLVYPPDFNGSLSGTVFSDFGAYSQLTAKCLQKLHVLEPFLQRCHQYCSAALAKQANSEGTQQFKTLLFGVTLQLQGFAIQILHNRRLNAGFLCHRALGILQLLGFVIEETGGKFEAYEFTYNICIDVMTEPPRIHANECVIELATWPSRDLTRVIDRGEVLFFIELCEKLLPKLDAEILEKHVLPIVRACLKPAGAGDSRQLLEAAHAFMLEYLNQGNSPRTRNILPEKADETAVMYFSELIALYPSILTWSQFKLALQRITEVLSQPFQNPTDVREYILNHLFELGKAAMPGQALPETETPQAGERPPTLRAVYVSSLIRALPDLCDQYNFGPWLQRVDSMIPPAYNDLTNMERRYLKTTLSETLSSLDQGIADVGIRYWFEQGSLL